MENFRANFASDCNFFYGSHIISHLLPLLVCSTLWVVWIPFALPRRGIRCTAGGRVGNDTAVSDGVLLLTRCYRSGRSAKPHKAKLSRIRHGISKASASFSIFCFPWSVALPLAVVVFIRARRVVFHLVIDEVSFGREQVCDDTTVHCSCHSIIKTMVSWVGSCFLRQGSGCLVKPHELTFIVCLPPPCIVSKQVQLCVVWRVMCWW